MLTFIAKTEKEAIKKMKKEWLEEAVEYLQQSKNLCLKNVNFNLDYVLELFEISLEHDYITYEQIKYCDTPVAKHCNDLIIKAFNIINNGYLNNYSLIGGYVYEVTFGWPHETYEVFGTIANSKFSAIYKAFLKSGCDECMTFEEFIKSDISKKVRKIGNATLQDLFWGDHSLDFCRTYRDMPFLKLGMRIEHDGEEAYIVGGSDHIHFYLAKDKSIVKDHPKYKTKYFDIEGNLIKEY